jgi:hypothetical protein
MLKAKLRRAAKAVTDPSKVEKYVDFCHEMAGAQYLTSAQRFEALRQLEARWEKARPSEGAGEDHDDHGDHADLPPELRAFESPAEQLAAEFSPRLLVLEKTLLASGTWSEDEQNQLLSLAEEFSSKLKKRMSEELDTFEKVLTLTGIGDFGTERFMKIYSATMEKIKSDDRESFDAMNSFVTLLDADWKGKECSQPHSELLPFYMQACETKPTFEALMGRYVSSSSAKLNQFLFSIPLIHFSFFTPPSHHHHHHHHHQHHHHAHVLRSGCRRRSMRARRRSLRL